LIQGGAELDIADTSYGRTAAHWAVYYQRDDILRLLIEAGEIFTTPAIQLHREREGEFSCQPAFKVTLFRVIFLDAI